MNTPGRPVRKTAVVGADKLARPTPGANSNVPAKKSAAPFSNPGKGAYVRKPVGVTPQTVPTHRTAGDASQPHNNKGGQNLSKKMKGVD